MAIVTISRIQHRRGLYENLPQLSAAEFGWAADERRLFIGNGPVSEGAPETGNTEILTEFSDVLAIADNYQFRNEDAGYTPVTGATAGSPTLRTLQRKFDDFVSVKDFGAKGDGSTDDAAAINRALFQLYCRESFPGARKALYFPAGRYMISQWIKVPTYATMIGEGPYNTILEHTGDPNDYPAMMQTADSKQQIAGSLGTNGAVLPSDIYIEGIGLECAVDGIYIQKCRRITLNRVRITGPETSPNTVLSTVSLDTPAPAIGLYISGTTVNPSEDINIVDCYLSGFNYGIWQDQTSEFFQNLIVSSGTFYDIFKAIYIAVAFGVAKNIIVTSSVFDRIHSSAIQVGSVDNFVSSFNHYRDVGTSYAGGGSPSAIIIDFGNATNHSASLGDLFDRDAIDDLAFPRYTGNNNTSLFEYGGSLGLGYMAITNGEEETLDDNTAGGSTTLAMNIDRYPHAKITYSLERGTERRSGTLNIAFDTTTGYSIDDDSTETGDVGVTFDVSTDGTTGTLTYTTSNTGADATLRYSVMRLTDVV